MLLINVPAPDPSVVLVASVIVGDGLVLQQMPLAVTVAPPSLVIFPPETAVVIVIVDTEVVVTVAKTAGAGGGGLNVSLPLLQDKKRQRRNTI